MPVAPAALGAMSAPAILYQAAIVALILAVAACLACGWWVVRLRRAAGRGGVLRHPRFFEALLENSGLSVFLPPVGGQAPLSFGQGRVLFQACRSGPDASLLAPALAALLEHGIAFMQSLRLADGRAIAVRGAPVGSRAALFFRVEAAAGSAQGGASPADALHTALRRFPVALAMFDADQRLVFYSAGYARLWDLSEAYLDRRPTEGEILDRLRDSGRLPEQRDFSGWKREQLSTQNPSGLETHAVWHLPDGRGVSVVRRRDENGGSLILFEDISERLAQETAHNLLVRVQRATLDLLDDAMAVFGPDGRLILHNDPFAKLWRLTDAELVNRPHCADIARLSLARLGEDDIWGAVTESVNAIASPAQTTRRIARRADGRTIALTLARLPSGATIASFSDLTDLDRFDRMQAEDQAGLPAAIPSGRG